MEICDNVKEVLNLCSNEIGKNVVDMFEYNTEYEFEDLNITSPIEQIMYTALKYISAINYVDSEYGKCKWICIENQVVIDKYRVDFMVSCYRNKVLLKQVIIECDSQEFHERVESERRYEKERDRYLQKKGYTIFHYTGKEIIKNYIKISKEIFIYLMGLG